MKKLFDKYRNMNIVVKASIWFTICSIIQKGISIITLPIFTRIMSIEQYGQYSVFLTWYNIILIIVTLNIQSEIFNKGLSEHKEDMDNYTGNQIGLLLVMVFIYASIYFVFRNTINSLLQLSTLLMVVMFLEIIGNTIIEFWRAQKRFEYSYKKIVLISLLCTSLSPILGIISVLNTNYKIEAKAISNMAVPFIIAIIILLVYRKKYKFFNNCSLWKKTILLALPLLPHYLSLIVLNQSDKLMINYFSGSSEAAIYSVAHSAGFLMIIINNSINSSFVPWCYDKLKHFKYDKFNSIISSLLLIVLTMNIILIWVAPEAISIFAPKNYYSAIWCLIPIAMSVFFSFIYSICVDIEVFYEKNNYITVASVLSTILNLILNYIFIPKFGFLAAGYTTLISYIVLLLLHCVFLNKITKKLKMKFSTFIEPKIVIIYSMILIFMSFVAAMLYSLIILRFIIIIIIFVLLYIYRHRIYNIFISLKNKENRD